MESDKFTYHHKPIEELTFTDDGMFQAVLHEPDICAELIERLLHIKVHHVDYPELEKQIAPYYTSKGVRLDVYVKDEDKIIDIELQAHPKLALGKRTRYYQSMIDMDSLMKGENYTKLKDSYILFICKFDPFSDEQERKYGLPCYTFRNICQENSAVNLNDNSVKVFYNAKAYKEEKDERIQKLLHFICTNEPGEDEFSNRLARLVEKIKDDEKFKDTYNAMNLHDFDIQMAAKQEGAAEKAVEAAKSFYANGASIELIAKSLNMTEEQVKEIVSEVVVAH